MVIGRHGKCWTRIALLSEENMSRPLRAGRYLDKTARLIAAMTCVENGIPYKEVDWKAIWEGYDLDYPGKRLEKQQTLKGGNPIVDNPLSIPKTR